MLGVKGHNGRAAGGPWPPAVGAESSTAMLETHSTHRDFQASNPQGLV